MMISNKLVYFGVMGTLILVASNAGAALDSSKILGGDNPINAFMDFLQGPFAVVLGIIAVLAFGVLLTVGQDFQGLARKIPMLILGLALVLGAEPIISKLRGSSTSGMLMPIVYYENSTSTF